MDKAAIDEEALQEEFEALQISRKEKIVLGEEHVPKVQHRPQNVKPVSAGKASAEVAAWKDFQSFDPTPDHDADALDNLAEGNLHRIKRAQATPSAKAAAAAAARNHKQKVSVLPTRATLLSMPDDTTAKNRKNRPKAATEGLRMSKFDEQVARANKLIGNVSNASGMAPNGSRPPALHRGAVGHHRQRHPNLIEPKHFLTAAEGLLINGPSHQHAHQVPEEITNRLKEMGIYSKSQPASARPSLEPAASRVTREPSHGTSSRPNVYSGLKPGPVLNETTLGLGKDLSQREVTDSHAEVALVTGTRSQSRPITMSAGSARQRKEILRHLGSPLSTFAPARQAVEKMLRVDSQQSVGGLKGPEFGTMTAGSSRINAEISFTNASNVAGGISFALKSSASIKSTANGIRTASVKGLNGLKRDTIQPSAAMSNLSSKNPVNRTMAEEPVPKGLLNESPEQLRQPYPAPTKPIIEAPEVSLLDTDIPLIWKGGHLMDSLIDSGPTELVSGAIQPLIPIAQYIAEQAAGSASRTVTSSPIEEGVGSNEPIAGNKDPVAGQKKPIVGCMEPMAGQESPPSLAASMYAVAEYTPPPPPPVGPRDAVLAAAGGRLMPASRILREQARNTLLSSRHACPFPPLRQ